MLVVACSGMCSTLKATYTQTLHTSHWCTNSTQCVVHTHATPLYRLCTHTPKFARLAVAALSICSSYEKVSTHTGRMSMSHMPTLVVITWLTLSIELLCTPCTHRAILLIKDYYKKIDTSISITSSGIYTTIRPSHFY